MATATANGTCYYNQNGGSWVEPFNNQIITGSTSGTTYRAYFSLNLGIETLSSVDAATITLLDTTDYNGPGYLTIGLCYSIPSTTFTSSDFNLILADNIKINRQTTNTITLGSTARNALKNHSNTTIYVCLLAGQGEYFEFQGTGSTRPKINISYTSFTKCTAPTVFNIAVASGSGSGNYIKRSGTLNISWSGAVAGTNNSIVGYTVYWRVTSGGTAPTVSNYSGSKNIISTDTEGSTTITLSSATRGYQIVCGIVTRGSAGEEWYSDIKVSSTIKKVNSLPSAPTVTANKTTLKSTESSVTISVTPGTDSDNQNITTFYSTSSTGENKISCGTSLELTGINNTTTYYFWSYDTMEYSSSHSSIKIVKNVKPTITALTATPTQQTALGTTGSAGSYFLGWVNSFNPKITGSKTGTVKWRIEFHATDGINTQFNTGTATSKNTSTQNFNLSLTSAMSIGTINIDKLAEELYDLNGANNYIRWRIRCILNDGIEDSDAAYFPPSGQYYAIADTKTILVGAYNQLEADEDIENTLEDHIGEKLRLKLYNDSTISTYSISSIAAKVGNVSVTAPTVINITTPLDQNTGYRYINVTLSRPTANSTLTFTVSCSNNNITKTFTVEKTECLHPNCDNAVSLLSTLEPYKSVAGRYEATATDPFNGGNLGDYECSGNAIALSFVGVESGAGSISKTLEYERSGSTISYYVLDSTITPTEWLTVLGIVNFQRYGLYSYKIRQKITNLYGMEFITDISTASVNQVNFNRALGISFSKIQFKVSNSDDYQDLGGTLVQEGLYLKFLVTCTACTAGDIIINVYRGQDTTSLISDVWHFNGADSSYPSFLIPELTVRMGEISEMTNIVWTITATYANTDLSSLSATCNSGNIGVLRQTAPEFSLTKCEPAIDYSTSFNLNITATSTDKGINESLSNKYNLTYYLYDTNNDITGSIANPFLQGGTSATVLPSYRTGWETKTIALKMVSEAYQTINGSSYSIQKVFYTNYVIVYQLQPTVAYRKNYLGINTKVLLSDAILDIHTITNRNRIYLNGLNGSFYLFVDEPVDISTTSTPNIIGNRGLAFDNNGTKVPVVTIESNGVATFTGKVIGDIQGNLTGDVTGNVSGTASNITGTLGYAHGGTNATSLDNARQNFGFNFTKSVASGSSINFTIAANTHALIFSTGGNGSNTKCMWLINTAGGTTPTPTYAEVFNGGSTVTVSASANKFTVNNGTTATMYFGIIVLGGLIT